MRLPLPVVAILVLANLVLVSSTGAGTASPETTDATDAPPNVVLIYADDLGFAELGCYGQERIRTPHIDRLAADGMRFTRFYSAAPVCAPARCSILTGRHAGHAVIRGNREIGGWGPEDGEGQEPLPEAEVTLAEHLRERGYATACIGKWGLGGPGTEGHPCRQGFDEFYGYICQRTAHNLYPAHLWRNHGVVILPGNCWFRAHQRIEEPLPTEEAYEQYRGAVYAPDRMADEAVAFIERQSGDRPFFLYFASPLPHVALQAPADVVDRYPREWDEAHYLGTSGYLPTPRPRATYAAMISALDDAVGRIMSALVAGGLDGDTLVLVTSDNGTTFAGGVDRAFFGSLGTLRGHKANLYEGGIRVPMVAWWPGRIEAGAVSDVPAYAPDLPATILELTDGEPVDADVAMDGISLAPTLLGSGEQRRHEALYFEYPEGRQQQAVILDGRWKAIRPDLKSRPEQLELYDLEVDPEESRDLAGEHPELVARARATMVSARRPSPIFRIPALDETP